MFKKIGFKAMLAAAMMAGAFAQPAVAAEVSGIKYADSLKVGGKDLQLNGLGVRNKMMFKVYATGLYLQDKKSTVEEVFAAEGPRRLRLVLMRDVSSESFGESFMSGINNNSEGKDKTRIVSQLGTFGEMFAGIPGLKKGDVLDLDYIPGTGTVCTLNGKQVGEPIPDLAVYNAIMRIWLGNKPADASLKPKLLAPAAKK